MLYRVSSFWARVEIVCAAALAASVTGLILLNVITRAAGNAIYWVDEAAIYAMVWMTFLAASAALHYRTAIAVTVVQEFVSPAVSAILGRCVDVVVFVFACALVWICLRWFMPFQLAAQGWDIRAFQGATFNFIYSEPTNTLGFKKAWVWLAVVLFTFGSLLHSAANLFHPGPADNAL
ncbi:MAG: TRAP transporter small permease [Sedimentitalea sp.]